MDRSKRFGKSDSVNSAHLPRLLRVALAVVLCAPCFLVSRGHPLARASADTEPLFDSLAIGVPWEDILDQEDGGIVQLLRGSAQGLTDDGSELWHEDSPGVGDSLEPYDRFGVSLASGDFNADGHPDLAIGAPGEDLGDIMQAGAVFVLYGDDTGLTSDGSQVWHQDSPGVPDAAEPTDLFGWSLAAADLNGDGISDLAIGAPGEALAGKGFAGAVHVLYGSRSGLSAQGSQFWNQDSPDVADSIEANDYFGDALAAGDLNGDGYADLAIAAPQEDLTVRNAGVVHVLYGSAGGLQAGASQLWHQDVAGVPDEAERDDRFGQALAIGDLNGDRYGDLVVGVPDEGLGSADRAGAIHVLYGSRSGLQASGGQLWHQDSPGISDAAEEADWFGRALAVGDLDGDGFADLAVGVLGEDVGSVVDCGAVHVLYGSAGGLAAARNQLWHQDSPGIADQAEEGDYFGTTCVMGDYDGDGHADLAIGVPEEDTGGLSNVGLVHVLYGSAVGLTSEGSQVWDQLTIKDRELREADDNLGAALATLRPRGRAAALFLPLLRRG